MIGTGFFRSRARVCRPVTLVARQAESANTRPSVAGRRIAMGETRAIYSLTKYINAPATADRLYGRATQKHASPNT